MSSYTYIATTAVGKVEALQAEIPEPEKDQVLIKVEYSPLTPFDLYQADQGFYVNNYPQALGVNASGTVVKFGSNVNDLKAGDRVIAFSYVPDYKGVREYTLVSRSVVAKIPDSLPLETAASIPDNFVTAFYTLFNRLELPFPADFPPTEAPPLSNRPLLIYGAGATSGQYAVRLLTLAGYKNVIAVASKKHNDYLHSLGATAVVDYRSPTFVEDVAKAAGGDGKVDLAMDCITLDESITAISKVIRPGGSIAWLAPMKHGGSSLAGESAQLVGVIPPEISSLFPEGVQDKIVGTFQYQQDQRLANTLMPKILPKLLEAGLIKPNRIILLDNRTLLDRVNEAFDLLRGNKVSGEKLVVKIGA